MIAYATTFAVVLRDGAGAPRTLGTFPGAGPTPVLAWSPNGKEIAWLANNAVNLTPVNGGPTRHWPCDGCFGIAFQGDQVVTVPGDAIGGAYTGKAIPELLVFPANGSSPLKESITGIPFGQIDTDFRLLGDSPSGTPVVAYGNAGGSDLGGAQQLYRVNQAGQATPLGQAPSSNPIFGDLGTLATDKSGDQVSVVTYTAEGACGGVYHAYVINSLTGAVTTPSTPSGGGASGFAVEGLWYDAAGNAYASLVSNPYPGICGTTGSPAPGPNLRAAIVCKLVGGQWVRTGAGPLQTAYAPGGWLAQTSPASSVPTPASLVISHGTTAITVPDVITFAWAP